MRVLLVEDEERLAQVVSEGLADDGIDVDVEHDGDSGLWRATEGSYDAIILDIMLPGLNGYQVCRELRKAEVWTPVLMLTAKDGEFDEAEALDTGADDFLRKPFSFVVLAARLRALVRRGAPARPAVLRCGSLRMDPATSQVWRHDIEIELTRREYALLEMLLRADEHVVSRQAIIDRVWGMDDEPASNVVDVYIRYLRQKIDEPFAADGRPPLITPVRGAGYRLTADAATVSTPATGPDGAGPDGAGSDAATDGEA
ncbi:MAG: response regulator transcription factor [Actinomycetota bacterium]